MYSCMHVSMYICVWAYIIYLHTKFHLPVSNDSFVITIIPKDKYRIRAIATLLVGFEVLTAVSTKMAVFWVVPPYSLVEVYQRFRGLLCLHHQGDGRAARTSETLVNFYQTTRRFNPEDSHLCLAVVLHSINSQATVTNAAHFFKDLYQTEYQNPISSGARAASISEVRTSTGSVSVMIAKSVARLPLEGK
jgi:hypothetical protein